MCMSLFLFLHFSGPLSAPLRLTVKEGVPVCVSISLSGLLSLDPEAHGEKGLEDLSAHVRVSERLASNSELPCHVAKCPLSVCSPCGSLLSVPLYVSDPIISNIR